MSGRPQLPNKSGEVTLDQGGRDFSPLRSVQVLFPGTRQVVGQLPRHPQHRISEMDDVSPPFLALGLRRLKVREQEPLLAEAEEVLDIHPRRVSGIDVC